ncbi:TMF-regulated nuclear 1 [Pelobates cultripes]|uniref:TMF-regulated nuclear 1 n=1 Tax=Pelobates cultripes TaxID=61616 RepID=A0AAD1VM96_PELCU|nr:TMF-regulated nuclear 1 [Pelobates cultripes]
MPLVQGSALRSLQRVFTHTRSANVPQGTEEEPSSPPPSTSFWKSSCTTHLFHRRSAAASCSPPRRSTSVPIDFTLKSTTYPSILRAPKSSKDRDTSVSENIISKSTSVPHTFLKPTCPQTPPKSKKSNAASTDISSQTIDSPNHSNLDQSALEMSTLKESLPSPTSQHNPVSKLSSEMATFIPTTLPSASTSASTSVPPVISIASSGQLHSPSKNPASQPTQTKHSPVSSPPKSSPAHSPLKSPTHHSSPRRHSSQRHKMPVAPGPTWSELLEARRRLLAIEGQRQAICALEMRVQQVHYVFLQAELRVARQREALARLVDAAGRAEVQATVHGQRFKRALRRHKPRLLACALCVPWGSKSERRGGQHSRHTRCAFFQGRVQGLRGCVSGEDVGTRD